MATINMLEETANYLLNHCFVLGGVEDQRAKYLYVQDHLDEVRAVFAPLGYSVLLYPAPLQAAALVERDDAKRVEMYKELQQRVYDNANVIPLFHNSFAYAFSDKVEGLAVDTFSNYYCENLSKAE